MDGSVWGDAARRRTSWNISSVTAVKREEHRDEHGELVEKHAAAIERLRQQKAERAVAVLVPERLRAERDRAEDEGQQSGSDEGVALAEAPDRRS